MLKLVSKFFGAIRDDGIAATASRVVGLANRKRRAVRLRMISDVEDRFTWIYEKNFWGSDESVSGEGSTLANTENLRRALPGLFAEYGIRRVFDAPCGDFQWMARLLQTVDVDYTGGDLVRPLVDRLDREHRDGRKRFVHINLITDTFPRADLMICRDCLFHLSYADAKAVLANFARSGIPYLLTTTHVNTGHFQNTDIRTGGFRWIDLFSEPFSLPQDTLCRIDDWVPPDPARQMCLWHREQIAGALAG
jgi:SAM-dependent methyltransferase